MLPTTSSFRHRRRCKLLLVSTVLLPFIFTLMYISLDFTSEQTILERQADFQIRYQYLESMYRTRLEDISTLVQYLGLSNGNNLELINNTVNCSILDTLSPDTKIMLKNATISSRYPQSIRFPTAFNFLPYLLDNPLSLRPSFLLSKGRIGVSIVLGIPTVKRDKQSYLIRTLHNLITNMNQTERSDCLIIIFIAEIDIDFINLVVKQIEVSFTPYIESGLIEILAPSSSYYPDFKKLHLTLNDSYERVKWRSKQNLDFSYLMTYAQTKGTFYVQLEDDILTKTGFISIMKKFALEKTAVKSDWITLNFCQLGFIGKMFKSAELPWLITFFQMFYNDKPVDWLLEYFIDSKICAFGKDCKKEKLKYYIQYKPSLFQHIGTTSSLKGKVQKLKDKQFGTLPKFYPHNNPPAIVNTTISAYLNFQLSRAYEGKTYFWGLLPKSGDLVRFIFQQPLNLKRYFFRSGNDEHPSDRFYNTTVEILPNSLPENSVIWTRYNITNDGYLIIGEFNILGISEGIIDQRIESIKEIRLHVHADSENWAILSEINLQDSENR